MRREFAMPDVGEGLTEAEIVTWNVAVGDTVVVNQILCEIETAKAAVELPSPFAGTIGALLAQPGETVTVGRPIVMIETAEPTSARAPPGAAAPSAARPATPAGPPAATGAAAPPGATAPSTAPTTSATPAAAPSGAGTAAAEGGAKIGEAGVDGRIATLVGYGPRPGSVTRRPRRTSPAPPAGTGSPSQQGDVAPTPSQPGDVAPTPSQQRDIPPARSQQGDIPPMRAGHNIAVPLAKPPVRKLAKDLGVDLREVIPSRPDGVITREDVRAYIDGAAAAGAPPAPVAAGERRVPIRGVRRATAAAMVASAFTAPHVTEFLAVDVTATMALRDRLRATREYADARLTPLAFVAKAVCLAARRTPEVNAHWDEAAGEIVYYDRVQLGIAAATPRGLIVPKIRNADTLSLAQLATALGELTATAREGKTPPTDLVGGTFTITNVGVFGVDTGTPILNPGEAAILAVGSIKQAPWVVDGALAVRTVCQLALSFDHRLVDGEQGSRFLADVGALLEDPALALTF